MALPALRFRRPPQGPRQLARPRSPGMPLVPDRAVRRPVGKSPVRVSGYDFVAAHCGVELVGSDPCQHLVCEVPIRIGDQGCRNPGRSHGMQGLLCAGPPREFGLEPLAYLGEQHLCSPGGLSGAKLPDLEAMRAVTWSERTVWGIHRAQVLMRSTPLGRGRYELNSVDATAVQAASCEPPSTGGSEHHPPPTGGKMVRPAG